MSLALSIALSSLLIVFLSLVFYFCHSVHRKLLRSSRPADLLRARRAALSSPDAIARDRAYAPPAHTRVCCAPDKDAACPVCLDDLAQSDDTRLAAGPCQHWMHAQCLEAWLRTRRNGLCPVCRAPVAASTKSAAEADAAPSRDPASDTSRSLSDGTVSDRRAEPGPRTRQVAAGVQPARQQRAAWCFWPRPVPPPSLVISV